MLVKSQQLNAHRATLREVVQKLDEHSKVCVCLCLCVSVSVCLC